MIIVLGCITFSAGLVALFLPETRNAYLADTVEEDTSLGNKKTSKTT